MKNIIIAFFIFLTLPTLAQNDLEGTWYGVVLLRGNISNVVRQEWKIEKEDIDIRYFLPV